MKVRREFAVMLPNRPGELARLAKALARAKVNIEAVSVNDGTRFGVVRLVVDGPSSTRQALRKAKLQFVENRVIAVPLADKPGALAELSSKLAQKGVNIDYVYGSTCSCECPCLLIMGVTDIEKAREALS